MACLTCHVPRLAEHLPHQTNATSLPLLPLVLPVPTVLCDGITDFLAPVCDFIVDHACSFVSDELRKHIPNSDICDHIHLC